MDATSHDQADGSVAVAEDDAPAHVDLGGPAPQPNWWHRDHPTFTALSGFFSGLVFATVVPGAFVAIVRALAGERTAEETFPFVLLLLAVPLGLMAFPRTRRFGQYLLFGIVVALLVIFGVGSVVFWLMMTYSS